MYEIVFTERGVVKQVWSGYVTILEARAAKRDADMCIPWQWAAEIRESK